MQEYEKLVIAIQSGSDGAFEQLYLTSYDRVYYYALTILKNESDTLDVTQEVFIKVHSSIRSLKEPKFYFTWLNRITHSKCIDFINKKKNIISTDEEESNIQFIDYTNPEDIVSNKEERDELLTLIDELDPKYSSVLYLKYFEERSMEEIAMITHTKEGTIKSRLHSAKKMLKTKMLARQPHAYVRALLFMILPASMVKAMFMPKAVKAMSMPTASPAPTVAIAGGVGVAIVASVLSLTGGVEISDLVVENSSSEQYVHGSVVVSAHIENSYNVDSIEIVDATGSEIVSVLDGSTISFEVNKNGEYTVKAYLTNDEVIEKSITIDYIDNDAPTIAGYQEAGESLVINLSDELSGIDMSTLIIQEGSADVTTKYLEQISDSSFTIKKPEEALTFTVKDNLGNTLTGTVKKTII